MAGGGGGEGNGWIWILVAGVALCGAGYGLELAELGPHWASVACLAVGGLAVVFGSVEAMIKSVEGVGKRLNWNQFVAGTIAGLASNLPEIVMLGFVVAAAPRVAFVVVTLTLHVNALTFGVYSGLLPRDESGGARLPAALVKISTDLYAAGGGVFLATGSLMLVMKVFSTDDHRGSGLGPWDLVVIGVCLLAVQVVATTQMVKRFSKDEDAQDAPPPEVPPPEEPPPEEKLGEDTPPEEAPPSWASIAGWGVLSAVTSLLGGHAVGDFADALVSGLEAAGYPEMIGAIILSIFAGAGAYVMIASAHFKGMYDVALAGVSGSITQVPFLVLPAVMLLIGVFSLTGLVPALPDGVALPIDLETTSVVLLAFPPMLILWKSVQDDGKVNWVETAGMVSVFGLVIYFLAKHG